MSVLLLLPSLPLLTAFIPGLLSSDHRAKSSSGLWDTLLLWWEVDWRSIWKHLTLERYYNCGSVVDGVWWRVVVREGFTEEVEFELRLYGCVEGRERSNGRLY